MKISIITVVYNRADTIGDAIDSVSRQTRLGIEHLVIDGMSTDGTLAQIEARQNLNLRIISEPDDGIYDALNKGIHISTGEIIGIVHSDDFLAHDRVLALVAEAFTDPAVDAVYGDLDYVSADDTTQIIRRWRPGRFHPRRLKRGWMPPHPALFVRRHIIEQYGAYDTSYRIAADYDAILRWFGGGEIRTIYIPEVLVKMRVGGESNRSLERIIRKSREDYRALRSNGIGGIGTLVLKNTSKVRQFYVSRK